MALRSILPTVGFIRGKFAGTTDPLSHPGKVWWPSTPFSVEIGIGMSATSVSPTFTPLESPWTVEYVSFDWYVPNLDSATRLTVEWNPDLEPHSPPGNQGWRHLFSTEYEPGSGVHREVIDFTTVSTARYLNLSFRFIPSQGNGETGFAVQDLGRGFSVVGATPEASAPTRVVAVGLILWTLRRSRARNRPSAAREAATP